MKHIIIFGLLLLLYSCNSCKDEELTLRGGSFTGDELRIDGYYYRKIPDLEIYFFYSNGIVRYGGGGYTSFEEVEERILNHQLVNENSRTTWGVFQVNNNTIKFERWYPSSGGVAPVYVREGTILNDTTFHITSSYRSDGSERREKNEMYHFHQFSLKPDSTNNFIK